MTTAMLLGLAWKSLVIAGLTLALLRLARSRSAGERSMIAHAGLAALLALPAALLFLPKWAPLPPGWFAAPAPATMISTGTIPAVPIPTGEPAVGPGLAAAHVPAATEAAGSAPATFPVLGDLASFLYVVPLALLCGVMLLAVVRLFAMRRRAEILVEGSWLSALAEAQRRMGFKHGTALLVSEELRSPISWGMLRPTIVLNPRVVAAVDEAEAIIAHELAHVARLDWAKLLGARAACAIFWFNPLVWMLARESHQLREEAADDAVLMADIDGPDYATLLVGAARHDNQGALLAAHGVAPGRGSLKRRITRVLDSSLKRGPASAGWMLMSLVLLAGISMPLAAFSTTADRSALVEARQAETAKAIAERRATVARAERDKAVVAAAAAKQARGEPLTAEQLISMRAVGVTPEDVRNLPTDDGEIDPDELIAAKAVGADTAYIRQMRRAFPGADMSDIIGARSVGVDPAYAREMQSLFATVGLDDLTAMRAMGIDTRYVRDMRGAGLKVATTEDAIEARALGLAHGVPNLRIAPRAVPDMRGRTGQAAVTIGGNAIEARGTDGSVARIEYPRPPEPPVPPEN